MDENGTYSWPGGQNTRPKKKPDLGRAGRTVIAVIAALVVLAVALTCFYTVDDKQQAVVTTFGKVIKEREAALEYVTAEVAKLCEKFPLYPDLG